MTSSNSVSGHFVSGLLLSIASLGLGFYFGSHRPDTNAPGTLTIKGEQLQPPQDPTRAEITQKNEVESENESDDEEPADGDLATIQAGFTEQCKLVRLFPIKASYSTIQQCTSEILKVLVVRTDLKMTPGKIAAQCGHATLACYKALAKKNLKLVQHWEHTGQAKIALRATSEDQLIELEAIAKSLNLCARSIQDLGRTQVAEGSRTVLGIGPAPINLINEVTGKLRLL
ncbi:peptidyl-tRNA hydrolase PTH2-domain-containing protein [Collybia nuda]|uniref:peptidyl-tRNA hydrolase n=1 Tax=Collybia nuda TaxID=64659 RepID=A0A9P5XZA9_9AGAR|nr:peptidyl-tRNA hydrolase PTH2-domain-containing protein [Collybia nuda]